jgi:hypothetical protein
MEGDGLPFAFICRGWGMGVGVQDSTSPIISLAILRLLD